MVLQRMIGYLKDEQGIETLEWIAIGALIIAVAIVVYPGTLQAGLTTVVDAIVAKLSALAT